MEKKKSINSHRWEILERRKWQQKFRKLERKQIEEVIDLRDPGKPAVGKAENQPITLGLMVSQALLYIRITQRKVLGPILRDSN